MSDKDKDHQPQSSPEHPKRERSGQAQSQQHDSAPETPASAAASRPPGSDARGDVEARLEALASEVTRLSEALRAQKMAFQDVEVSLVSRIGDVDDDRRQAATRLQRTLQSQRDDLDERLRRQSSLITVIILVFFLLVGGALTFVYYQVGGMRESLAAQVGEIGKTVDRLNSPAPVTEKDPIASEQLTKLSEAVEEITTSLERLSEEAEATALAAATPSEAPVQPTTATAPTTPAAETAAEPATETRAEESETAPGGEIPASDGAAATDMVEQAEPTKAAPPPSEIETSAPSAPAPAATPPEQSAADADESEVPEASTAAQTPRPAPGDETGDMSQDAASGASETPEQPAQAAAVEEASAAALAPVDQPQVPEATEPATETEDVTEPTAGRIQLGDQNVTLQLLGFYSLDDMERFVAGHELPSTLYYQTTTYRGRPWYVLIHSLHASQEAAEETAGALPADLAKLQIWIRQLDPEDEVTLVRPPAD